MDLDGDIAILFRKHNGTWRGGEGHSSHLLPFAWLKYCLVQTPHDSTVNLSFSPEKKNYFRYKVENVFLERAVFAFYNYLNPISSGL